MSTKFNLERFKAGDVAINSNGKERHYIGFDRQGRIVVEFEDGTIDYFPLGFVEDTYTMKPKEEWTVVAHNNAYVVNKIYASKEEALKIIEGCNGRDYEAVKIIRE